MLLIYNYVDLQNKHANMQLMLTCIYSCSNETYYVDLQLIHVDYQLIYIDIQLCYVDIQLIYVNIQLKHVAIQLI